MSHRNLITLVAAAAVACTFWSAPARSADAQTTAFAQQVKGAMSPADQAWLRTEGVATRKAPRIATSAIASRVNARFAGRAYQPGTLDAIMMVVLAEAEQDARADMQRLAALIEASNRYKDALRQARGLLNESSCSDGVDQQAAFELQKAAQQASEAATLASNIAKKYHAVMMQIIGNLRA